MQGSDAMPCPAVATTPGIVMLVRLLPAGDVQLFVHPFAVEPASKTQLLPLGGLFLHAQEDVEPTLQGSAMVPSGRVSARRIFIMIVFGTSEV